MRTLKLPRPSYFLLCLLTSALLLAATSLTVLAKTFHIHVTDESFDPDSVTISVGDTVVWTSKSSLAHTLEAGDDQGGACSEDINHTFSSNGDTFSHTFTVPKPCYFTCRLHGAGMNGVINVKGGEGTTTTTIQGKCKDKTKDCKE